MLLKHYFISVKKKKKITVLLKFFILKITIKNIFLFSILFVKKSILYGHGSMDYHRNNKRALNIKRKDFLAKNTACENCTID